VTKNTPIKAHKIPAILKKESDSLYAIIIIIKDIAILIFTAIDVLETPFFWELIPIKINNDINNKAQQHAKKGQFPVNKKSLFHAFPYKIIPKKNAVK
jgi:hypothetical protein